MSEQDEASIRTNTTTRSVPEDELRQLVQAHLDGLVSDDDLAVLERDRTAWVAALETIRREVEATVERIGREVTGPERELVVADFQGELDRIDEVLVELTGRSPGADAVSSSEVASDREASDEDTHDRDRHDDHDDHDAKPEDRVRSRSGRDGSAPKPTSASPPAVARLQLSWHKGDMLAWAATHGVAPEPESRVLERLEAAGAPDGVWTSREGVKLPTGDRAPAVAASVQATLGWLVALGGTPEEPVEDDTLGPSVVWTGRAAALAVRLVAQGRMVPQLRKVGDAEGNRSYFAVSWEPSLVDHAELSALARAMPGTVGALSRQRDTRPVTRAVVSSFVDAICRDAASRVEVPAPPPQPGTASDVAEAVLGRLDGSTFEAPHQQGTEIGKGLRTWAVGVTGATKLRLMVQLDPPDDSDAWHLRTLLADNRRKHENVEAAMSRANHERKEAIKRELERLEGLYEPLGRSKDTRRGQVLLDQDEAWELMTTAGPVLQAAGFDVRVPPLSRRKATPSLRVTSVESKETAVGAQQLSDVRWSAVFDDVELSAEDIQRLAKESRPLVRSQGRWVEVDHADLEAAAAALEERAERTTLTGADMLRYALGLDGAVMGQPVSVAGDSWAVELLRSAQRIPNDPPTRPDGFVGELRNYQANALAWLGFLDEAGLGGCLALDMGLGKTPVMLAHLRASRERGPALVVAPPAVVGNWASEANRFVPDLRVVIHHGATRAEAADIADEIADADVLLTTYGTAIRDIDGLAQLHWDTVVLDEAQVIKNPLSETAQQLRRLEARARVVLTGTPIENGLGDLWALMDFVNPGLVGDRATFVAQMQRSSERGDGAESALRALNGVLVFRRTKAEPVIAEELPDRIDSLDHCPMTPEQIGLYQAVLDELVTQQREGADEDRSQRKGAVLAAITALKQICNHPAAYTHDDGPLDGRSGKLDRLEEIVDNVYAAGERMLVFTHFATWGERLAEHLTKRTGDRVVCYHGGLSRGVRDRIVREFQEAEGPGVLVLSLKAGGSGLNLTAASHVVLYDRWWNPAVEDQARDRAWRIGQTRTVVAHRLVCPGTVDGRVEEVVAGKRRIADLALPRSSSVGDLDTEQLQRVLGIDADQLLTDELGRTSTTAGGDG